MKSANVKIIDKENAVYHSGTVVLPSYFAKGLEFDAVIMVLDEPSDGHEAILIVCRVNINKRINLDM